MFNRNLTITASEWEKVKQRFHDKEVVIEDLKAQLDQKDELLYAKEMECEELSKTNKYLLEQNENLQTALNQEKAISDLLIQKIKELKDISEIESLVNREIKITSLDLTV